MHQTVLRTVAAGGEHPLIDIDLTVLIQFGLFALMALLATRLLFRPYLKMREERTAGIDGARHEAHELSAEADGRLVDYEAKLAAARDRALEEQRKIRAEAAAHQHDVTEKARSKSLAALEEARTGVREQTEAARAELTPRADALAGEIVGKLLGRQVA